MVGEGNNGASHLDKSVTGVYIGNVGKLEVGNVQEPGKLHAVGAGLVEHDDEFRVGQHGAGRMALQKVVHILGDARAKSAILSDSLPEREQEVGAVFMLEQQIDFINNNEGIFALCPVLRDAV